VEEYIKQLISYYHIHGVNDLDPSSHHFQQQSQSMSTSSSINNLSAYDDNHPTVVNASDKRISKMKSASLQPPSSSSSSSSSFTVYRDVFALGYSMQAQSHQGGIWHTNSEATSNYLQTINRFLYKNALFNRLYLPYRFIAYVQIDIYALKEIIQVKAKSSSNNNNSNHSQLVTSSSSSSSGSLTTGNFQNIMKTISASNPLVGNLFPPSLPPMKTGSTNISNNSNSSSNNNNNNNSNINAISTVTTASTTNTAVPIFGANLGQSAYNTNGVYSITPATNVRGGNGMEIYAVIRLVKYHYDVRVDQDYQHYAQQHAANNLLFLASRVYADGSYITPIHRAESMLSTSSSSHQSSQGNNNNRNSNQGKGTFSNKAAASSSSTPSMKGTPGSNHDSHSQHPSQPTSTQTIAGKYSKHILSQIQVSIDYEWRSQGIFRFALPEGWINLIEDDLQTYDRIQHNDIRHSLPPMKILMTVYERSFFGDNKIGETEISLLENNDKNIVKDWFPLIQDRKTNQMSWMIYCQAKLRFHLMKIEEEKRNDGFLNSRQSSDNNLQEVDKNPLLASLFQLKQHQQEQFKNAMKPINNLFQQFKLDNNQDDDDNDDEEEEDEMTETNRSQSSSKKHRKKGDNDNHGSSNTDVLHAKLTKVSVVNYTLL
jgi:hypothetical protein